MFCRICDEIDHELDVDVCSSCIKALEQKVTDLTIECEKLRNFISKLISEETNEITFIRKTN